VERVVKAPGTQLKSAPFQSATSLQSLPAGAHVAILISTAYWYGVETEDGQHGWIHRSQLEQLP
jgi:SH3-like domain-containing protein